MTAPLPDLERVYAEAVSAAWIALPLDRDPNFNEQDHVHGAGLLAVYRAGQKATRWQPIETAPKDGQEIIVIYMRQGGVKKLVFFDKIHGYWSNKGTPCLGLEQNATHWQPIPPLPEPPQSVTEGAE